MNVVVLMGRMTRDAEVRYANDETHTPVARFTLAVDRRIARNAGETTADFISCVAFGKRAEFMEKYGRKGTKFVIDGRIQTGSYKKSDGSTVYTTDIVVENVEFAESKAASTGEKPAEAKPDENGFVQVPNSVSEELPFN